MEPGLLLLCSQEPATGPYRGPDDTVSKATSHPTTYSKIHSNIILPYW